MPWDLRLDHGTRDLVAGYVSSQEEILQRLITRLKRELGEWFLETSVGLPWYQEGYGLLGSKNQEMLDMLIRAETLGTDGVERILDMRTIFVHREYSIYMLLLIAPADRAEITMNSEGFTWRMV